MSAKSTPIVVDTREQLLHLLAEASEFEHNLLCCYLYAAFSLKRAPIDELSDEESAAIVGWRDAIMSVALEEMTHLALVANLTVAIGARAHFNRPNLPVAPGYHPAGMVVELAPFDMDTLDHFVFLERPEGIALPDGEGFEPEAEYARGTRRGAALMPAAHDYETIAEFYQAIRDGFVLLTRELGEPVLFSGDPAMQVGADVASMPGLVAVTDLASALAAIDTIVVQGEGSPADAEGSHYARFRSIKEEFKALLAKRPSFVPARPVARNPVMRRPVETGDRVYIDSKRAAAVLDLANALYNHLLRLLCQAYGRAQPTPEAKRTLIEAAMKLMQVFGATSEYLATLPASDHAPGVNAGVSFAMLRATEPLVESIGEWAVIGERFDELVSGMREVCACVGPLQRSVGVLEGLARTFQTSNEPSR